MVFLLLWSLLVAPSSPVQFTIFPQSGKYFDAVFVGPARDAPSGEFRGALALNGSAASMALVGRAERAGSRLRVRATLRYADVPADWTSRFRSDGFEYRIEGRVAESAPIEWTGSLAWEQVSLGGDENTVRRFVGLTSLELTKLSLKESQGLAVLRIENPFSFPITVASASYRLRVNGETVGGGTTRGRILRPQRANGVELPFTVDHREFVSVAGDAVVMGREFDARLDGVLVVRLPSGDVRVPLDLSGKLGTNGARSGVFSLPEGGTSVSPHR